MRYTVWLHASDGIYEAIVPAVPGCTGRGSTRDEALAQLRETLRDRLDRTEITSIDVDFPKSEEETQNPWMATAGMFSSDPMLDPVLREIYSLRDIESSERT